jgi:hypothetical protein
MQLKTVFYTIFISLAIISFSHYLSGCANMVAPTGGPKDTLPPVLINVSPKDSALNFNSKRITFTFNEYVELSDLTQNLIVSPTPKLPPQIDAKLRTITVRLKDTLEENTTYSLQFGNAIRDLNEGNVLPNYTYLFSTGNRLDQGTFQGRVLLAETGTVDSTLIVMLHRSGEDSAVYKSIPRYFTRLDSSGTFRFRNLPESTFYVYALKDESGIRRYQGGGQLFAFADKPVTIGGQNDPLTLYAFIEKEEEAPRRPTPRNAGANTRAAEDKRLRYQVSAETGQDLLTPFTMTFPTGLKTFDSTKLILTDTSFNLLPGAAAILDTGRRIITISQTWVPGKGYRLLMDKEFAEDSAGRKLLKSDTLDFLAKKESDYGTLRLRFPSLDLATHPVLQFVQGGKVVQSHVFTTKEFNSRLFNPGDYELRILYDENQNGIWDTGVFFGQRRQPEKAITLKMPLKVRPNWDNDDTIRDLQAP